MAATRLTVILALISIFLSLGLLLDYLPSIIDRQIKKTVELATNEMVQQFWSRPPITLRSAYWLYDIENPDQFLKGDKVRVRKVGPYNFKSQLEKRIISVSDNKYKITYNSTRYINWDDDSQRAQANLNEIITTPNSIHALIVNGARELSVKLPDPTMRKIAMASAERLLAKFNETLLLRSSARELLFGRKYAIFSSLSKLAAQFGVDEAAPKATDDESPPLPDSPANDTFGYATITNGTWSGPFEVYSGFGESASSLGNIVSYRGRKRQSVYSGKCNRIQTSAGELRPMPLKDNETLEMYRPEMCRVVHLDQQWPPVLLAEGHAYRYKLSPSDWQPKVVDHTPGTNDDDDCYCVNTTLSAKDYCSLSGVIELGPCALHAPFVLHLPNLELDREMSNTIGNWDKQLTDSSLDDLPETGINNDYNLIILKRYALAIKFDLTFVNFVKIRRDAKKGQLAQLPEVSYVPLFMVREIGELPPQFAQIFMSVESFIELSRQMRIVMYLSAVLLLVLLASHQHSRLARARLTSPQVARSGGDSIGDYQSDGNDADKPRLSSGDTCGRMVCVSVGEPIESTETIGALTRQPSSDEPTQTRNQQQQQQRQRRSLIFSMVDEEHERQEAERAQPRQSFAKIRTTTAAGDANETSANANESNDDPRLEQNERDSVSQRELEELELKGATDKKRRLNWLTVIYGNFSRALGGIRSSMKEATQFDVATSNTNKCQDKRIEELAGKIDNWASRASAGDDAGVDGAQAEPPPSPAAADSDTDRDTSQTLPALSGEPEAAPSPEAAAGAAVVSVATIAVPAATAAAATDASPPTSNNNNKHQNKPDRSSKAAISQQQQASVAKQVAYDSKATVKELISKATSVDLDILEALARQQQQMQSQEQKHANSDSAVKLNAGTDQQLAATTTTTTTTTATEDDDYDDNDKLASSVARGQIGAELQAAA